MQLSACTICGAAVVCAPGQDSNALCAGCAPNLAGSVDRRLLDEAPYVPDPLLTRLLEEVRR